MQNNLIANDTLRLLTINNIHTMSLEELKKRRERLESFQRAIRNELEYVDWRIRESEERERLA